MFGEVVTSPLKAWLVALFVRAIAGVARTEGRAEVVCWLSQSRDILASNQSLREKFSALHALIGNRKAVAIVASLVAEAVKNYRNSDLPLPVKVAVPVTLLAMPLIGGQGIGVAALGGGMVAPALLLVFLGTAGISTILEAVGPGGDGPGYLKSVTDLIDRDETLSRASASMRDAMQAEPRKACRYDMPTDVAELRKALLAMNPFDFERHVMSFFSMAGLEAWVTRRSNDMGVDGFARHPKGVVVVQCKRNSAGNLVGRPVIQQMKGVVAENGAWRGYLVTTSGFTDKARMSAGLSDRLVLVGMAELVRWHFEPPRLVA